MRARAALVLLLCLPACRGFGGTGSGGDDAWITGDPVYVEGTRLPVPLPSTRAQARTDSSPVGALLSHVFFSKDPADQGRSRRHVRVEPVPILGEREIGFSLTVHW